MAKCEEGYLCSVCGEDVESICDSDLYLRYIIGQIDPEILHTNAERHIKCNPTLAQFIVDSDFPPIKVENEFSKEHLDDEYVRSHEDLVTRGWQRLQQLNQPDLPIIEYPLDEVRARFQNK